ncbi:MAG TPA: DedA family protein [Alphaproteobacteria bacterium]|jgi:membrane protein DedA with SNARE-associated domain|nr:DedA family protein [Alphaproteobacteria bacterium]
MSLESLLAEYGYWLIFATTFIEGESVVLIAGVAAAAKHLELHWVILTAYIGSYLGDQLWFHVGRRHGKRLLERFPRFQGAANRVFRLLERYDTGFILTFRFVYGVRNVTPFALGMSNVSALRFAGLNFIAAGMWAVTFAGAGYLFGHAVIAVVGDMKAYIGYVLLGLLFVALALWLYKLVRKRRNANNAANNAAAQERKPAAQRQAPPVTRA